MPIEFRFIPHGKIKAAAGEWEEKSWKGGKFNYWISPPRHAKLTKETLSSSKFRNEQLVDILYVSCVGKKYLVTIINTCACNKCESSLAKFSFNVFRRILHLPWVSRTFVFPTNFQVSSSVLQTNLMEMHFSLCYDRRRAKRWKSRLNKKLFFQDCFSPVYFDSSPSSFLVENEILS